ncbi:MAG: response regulator [Spirochaetes bacterium]|nr:response regulator [Spirochaetota bacterium]
MKHIMIIDDSPTIRTSVEYALMGLGYPIANAENGSDALKKIAAIKGKGDDVALCIVDVNMPVMDGITFIGEFRKDDKFTPVLVLTTESEEQKIRAGKEAGASGWIVKPFSNQDMVKVVQRLVK